MMYFDLSYFNSSIYGTENRIKKKHPSKLFLPFFFKKKAIWRLRLYSSEDNDQIWVESLAARGYVVFDYISINQEIGMD
jgi:hypothetical protein